MDDVCFLQGGQGSKGGTGPPGNNGQLVGGYAAYYLLDQSFKDLFGCETR